MFYCSSTPRILLVMFADNMLKFFLVFSYIKWGKGLVGSAYAVASKVEKEPYGHGPAARSAERARRVCFAGLHGLAQHWTPGVCQKWNKTFSESTTLIFFLNSQLNNPWFLMFFLPHVQLKSRNSLNVRSTLSLFWDVSFLMPFEFETRCSREIMGIREWDS